MQFPAFPDVPSNQRTTSELFLRYEDIAQDGSLKVGLMPSAIGLVPMSKLWFRTDASRALRPQGVLPILTRLAMQTTGAPLSIRNPVEVDGAYQLGHARDEHGAVQRIFVNGHAELYAPRARIHPPQPENAGERIHVGRVFAEHVFTRPFAGAEDRKVRALPLAEGPFVPELALPSSAPLATLDVRDARWLDAELVAEPWPVVFGVTHTDANMHVNSLVYPRLFEEAALRRAFALGRDTRALHVEAIEVSYRKPCFAGEHMQVSLRLFERSTQLGAVGTFGPPGQPSDRAHATCALIFRDSHEAHTHSA